MMQRCKRAITCERRGERVTDRQARTAGRSIRFTTKVTHATHRFANRSVTGPRGIWPRLTIAGNPYHDNPWIDLDEILIPQSPALHGAGAKILEHHIGTGNELLDKFLTLILSQVCRYTTFVTRAYAPPKRVVAAAPYAHRVTFAGRLDLDDVGSHIGHELAAVRTGNQLPEFDKANIRERALALRWVSHIVILLSSY